MVSDVSGAVGCESKKDGVHPCHYLVAERRHVMRRSDTGYRRHSVNSVHQHCSPQHRCSHIATRPFMRAWR